MGKMYCIERAIISKLLETKDFTTITDKKINSSFFEGEHKQAFNFIKEYYLKNSEMPTVRVFKNKMPTYKLEYLNKSEEIVGTEEPLLHWCEEVRTKMKHNKLADITESMATHLEDRNPEEAYNLMKKGVLYIESEIEESSSVDITKDIDSRKKAYLERKENKGLIGIPTGIEKLDAMLKGSQKEQLTTIMAGTGVGKTFLTCIIGAYAQLNGYRVLQFVTEMSGDVMRDRYEAILYGMINGDFNYSRFKSGGFDWKEEENYFKFLDNDLPNLTPLMIEVASGVSSVASKINQYNPDLVLIDSVYLMEDDQGAKDDWLRVAHIVRDLKKLAKRTKKPIIINTQTDITNTSEKTGADLRSTRYAKSINEDSDNVITAFQDEQMREDREIMIKVLKQREGVHGKVMMNWDFSRMNFESLYAVEEKQAPKEEKPAKEKKKKDAPRPEGVIGID